MIIKTTVFDVPAEVWRSGFDSFSMGAGSTAQVITFKKYNTERSNTEFVRDFNLACAVQPHLTLLNSKTGDQIHVNKGFFDQMFLADVAQSEGDEESKFGFLAESEELDAAQTDFTDQASLLRRQKLLLDQIESHQAKKFSGFDPLKVLKSSSVRTEDGKKVPLKWILLLCHGGKFVLQAYEDLKCVHSCSDSKYVIRKKSGGR